MHTPGSWLVATNGTRPILLPFLHKSGALCAILLSSFFLRAFLSAGWMPGVDAAGGSAIVICTAQGMATVHLDEDGNPIEDQKNHGQPCVFAALASLTAPSSAAEADAVPLPAMSSARFEISRAIRAGPQLHLSDAPARAPPHHS